MERHFVQTEMSLRLWIALNDDNVGGHLNLSCVYTAEFLPHKCFYNSNINNSLIRLLLPNSVPLLRASPESVCHTVCNKPQIFFKPSKIFILALVRSFRWSHNFSHPLTMFESEDNSLGTHYTIHIFSSKCRGCLFLFSMFWLVLIPSLHHACKSLSNQEVRDRITPICSRSHWTTQ